MALFNTTLNAAMRGVVYSGVPYEVTVQNLPVPSIINQINAVVRITTSGICGSDLHYYRGVIGGSSVPFTVGYEAIGYISEVRSAVSSLSVGDYVVISDTASHGSLQMETAPDEYFGGGGDLDGLQAEYARVRFADAHLIPVPPNSNTTTPSLEQNYVTVGDIFATAWTALNRSGFEPRDSVAVSGAGPVSLLAAYSAILRGASLVYSVDHVQQRLDLAEFIDVIPTNFVDSDPLQNILSQEPGGATRRRHASLNAKLETDEDILIRQMVGVTRVRGGIGIAGAYQASPDGSGVPCGSSISPNATLPMTEFFSKGLSIRGGPVDPKLVAPELARRVRLIARVEAHPSFITSAVIDIEEAPQYYQAFNRQDESKVFIRFA
ncbi:S-(hydroxymethyl)glutathione dehydrogenase 3 [Colletotrichum chlorophyti]|uniref:S-(Hydroxymethyl)glutathione dehydrogenase 3 n=1 Tax=Colletotrichum chlorophyti TaxID=708187 RepID=A0A1Q8RT91_9PEZI|nr:S-(hydroxymethyl)glutathione dehydrogenase 3 [Colletotrichum chlorophyti]